MAKFILITRTKMDNETVVYINVEQIQMISPFQGETQEYTRIYFNQGEGHYITTKTPKEEVLKLINS